MKLLQKVVVASESENNGTAGTVITGLENILLVSLVKNAICVELRVSQFS